jgi:hypothetical protein
MIPLKNVIFIQTIHYLGFVLNTYAYFDDTINWKDIMQELPLTHGSIRISILRVR